MTHEELVARTLARFRFHRGGKPNGEEVVEAIRFALDEARMARPSKRRIYLEEWKR